MRISWMVLFLATLSAAFVGSASWAQGGGFLDQATETPQSAPSIGLVGTAALEIAPSFPVRLRQVTYELFGVRVVRDVLEGVLRQPPSQVAPIRPAPAFNHDRLSDAAMDDVWGPGTTENPLFTTPQETQDPDGSGDMTADDINQLLRTGPPTASSPNGQGLTEDEMNRIIREP